MLNSIFNNLSQHTIVIDDPITSFDYFRKSTTLNILYHLSQKAKQLILLTHDLKFAHDFTRKFNYKNNNIKIEFNGNTSHFVNHDIEKECLTGIFKDLSVLKDYLNNGCTLDIERREVLRCIRPLIEGVFRIKFFGDLKADEWLGDIIDKIKNSNDGIAYGRYQPLLNDLIEINNYSKVLHHSNPYHIEEPINDYELRIYVNRTLELIQKI